MFARKGVAPNTVWLNGPDAGKPVRDRPIRNRSFKIDHEAAELGMGAEQLERLDQVGVLKKRAAYASALADRTKADVEIAELVQHDRWLLGAQRPPPRRWPVVALLAVQALTLGLLLWVMTRASQPYPSLPARESASDARDRPQKGAASGQGRVGRADSGPVATDIRRPDGHRNP